VEPVAYSPVFSAETLAVSAAYLAEWREKMTELERPERLQIMLSAEELTALENFRFDKRMPSRAAAVRELLRRGLAAEGFLVADPHSKSRDFSVVGRRRGNGQTANED
jgi:hypothetical protein